MHREVHSVISTLSSRKQGMSLDLGQGSWNKELFKTGKDCETRKDREDTPAQCRVRPGRILEQSGDRWQTLNSPVGGTAVLPSDFLTGRPPGGNAGSVLAFGGERVENLGVRGHPIRREGGGVMEQMQDKGWGTRRREVEESAGVLHTVLGTLP